MKVLVINSYAGSITLGARAAGAEIVGSYEDSGFGIAIQKANFPDIDFKDTIKDWPDQDLSDVTVVAHPPCAAFSAQQSCNAADKRGLDTAAFACTKKVLDYAMGNGAKAIAIESVPGAYMGAAPCHNDYAKRFGYDLYRVMQNAAMFGAPQWRERFWAIFVKKGAVVNRQMLLQLNPSWATPTQVLEGTWEADDAPNAHDLRHVQRLATNLQTVGLDVEAVKDAYLAQDHPSQCRLCFVAAKMRGLSTSGRSPALLAFMKTAIGGTFASHSLAFVHPEGFAPVLTWSAFWYLATAGNGNGRLVTERGYKALMGFPVDYVFPEKGGYRRDYKKYLSKGVVPAVAQWVVEQVGRHTGDLAGASQAGAVHVVTIGPNETASFLVKKKPGFLRMSGQAGEPPLVPFRASAPGVDEDEEAAA